MLKQIFKIPYFWIIAFDGAFGLTVFYYWLLRQNTTLGIFWDTMKWEPWYLYPDLVLTFFSIAFFGIMLAVMVYSFPRASFSWKGQGSGFGGFVFGAFGVTCPICGAFLFSLVGLSGGLAILPLAGLELKILSVLFFGGALYFSLRKLNRASMFPPIGGNIDANADKGDICEGGACEKCRPELAQNYDYKIPLAVFFVLLMILGAMILPGSKLKAKGKNVAGNLNINTENINQDYETIAKEIFAKVLPKEGFIIPIKWNGVISKVVELDVIDLEKFTALYENRDGLGQEEMKILTDSSYNEYIKIDRNNANFLVNVFWALGLANKNPILDASPMITGGYSVFNFASTGGWTLGKDEKGGNYYNKYEIIKLTPEQQEIAQYVADGSYRPCCNNPTSFPDCNHGAALLGLIELGASQGLTKEELFDAGVKFNSFWFPQNYLETALYFKLVENTDWENVDSEKAMSYDFSSVSGWRENVHNVLSSLDVLPQVESGGGCGV